MRRSVRKWTVAGLIAAVSCAGVGVASRPAMAADAPQSPPVNKAAEPAFRPVTDKTLEAAKGKIVTAVAALQKRLSQGDESAADWRKFLLLDSLAAELKKKGLPDKAVLEKVYSRFAFGDEGLGLIWFVDVREAIESYLSAARTMADPQAKARYDAIRSALARRLASYRKSPTPEDALWITGAVRWLSDTKQDCGDVVREVKSLHQPNLYIAVGEELLDAAMGGPVSEPTSVRDCILGTDVHSTGVTNGTIKLDLVPNPDYAVLDMYFFGIVDTNSVGYHPPVEVYTTGQTRIGGIKRVWIDEDGLYEHPACSNVEMNTCITGICAPRPIIERIASRKAEQQKPKAEAIATQRATARANEQIDARGADMLTRSNESYTAKFRDPLTERKLFPRSLAYSTTDDQLQVVALQADGYQLASPGAPPAAAAKADMTVRVHESMINNTAWRALAGMTVHEETLRSMLQDLLGRVPEALNPDEERLPWAIEFAADQPISVKFGQDRFQVNFRGLRYTRGDTTYPGMYVTVDYRIERTPAGFKAVRQGPLQIFPPDVTPSADVKLTPRQVAIRRLLDRRFSKIFPEEMVAKGLELPGNMQKAGKLFATHLTSDNGWLSVGWTRQAPAPATASNN